jgi:hypothetical protein
MKIFQPFGDNTFQNLFPLAREPHKNVAPNPVPGDELVRLGAIDEFYGAVGTYPELFCQSADRRFVAHWQTSDGEE